MMFLLLKLLPFHRGTVRRKDNNWFFHIDVNMLEGVGRF